MSEAQTGVRPARVERGCSAGCGAIQWTNVMPSFTDRRNFLRFLAASPLVARAYAEGTGKIASPKDVLAVMDLEEVESDTPRATSSTHKSR